MKKDLEKKAVTIKGKKYIQVKDRILSMEGDKYSIDSKYKYYPERKMWVVKAVLTLDKGSFTGHAQEIESDNWKEVNATSALENAETSAVGRAFAMAGIGVLDSIASVDEINKANNRTPQANFNPATEKQPSCDICGQPMTKGQYGWYCKANYDDPPKGHKGKKGKPVYPEEPKSKAVKNFENSLPDEEITIEDIL